MMAYQQILMLIGGFVCLSFGILLAGNEIYFRRRAVPVAGIIAGVRSKGNVFYPVYRYQLPGGDMVDATSDIGSAGLQGKETGRMVPLLVVPGEPTSARPAGNWAFGAFGLFLGLAGVLLIALAFTHYPVTRMSKVVAVGMFCYAGMKLQTFLIPKGQKMSLANWRAAMKQKHDADMQTLPILRAEDIAQTDGSKAREGQQAKTEKIVMPLLLLVGAALLWLGMHSGNKLATTLQYGTTAEGHVISLKGDAGADSGALYPTVSFTDAAGRKIEFRDDVGKRPAEFETGDTVTVIYRAEDPETTAFIDRGVYNYLRPLVMLFFGTLFSGIGLALFRKSRRKKPEGP